VNQGSTGTGDQRGTGRSSTAAVPKHRNPTIGTLVEVAAALGLKVELVSMADEERKRMSEPLRSGVSEDPTELVRAVQAAGA
jgi:hypothetical protein